MRRRDRSFAARFSDRVRTVFAGAGLERGLQIVAAAAEQPAEILLYDEIGYFGISARDFVEALAQVADGPLTLRINSPGGDVFDGMAIYNALKTRGQVDCVIDGLAASAASFVAMAGDSISIAENAMLMIHNCWGLVIGDADDMRTAADLQDKIDGQIAGIYAARTGMGLPDCAAAMDAETWYTGQEAVDGVFCDAVIPNKQKPEASAPERRARTPRAAAASWKVGAQRDLPTDDTDGWDGAAAAESMLDAAGFNGASPDSVKARRGFLVYDSANPTLKASYKLPFANMVNGELRAIKSGLNAAAQRLPQTDLADDIKSAARAVIDHYQARYDESARANAVRLTVSAHARQRRLRLAAD